MTNPNFQQQGQGQPPVQSGQQGMGQYANLSLRIQHGDRNFPEELWGRTLREGMQYYAVMREDFLRRQREDQARQQQPAQQPQQQFQQPQAQQPQQQFQRPQPQQQPAQGQPQMFDENAVRRIVQESLTAALQPYQGATQQQVYQQVRAKFPDWNFYDAEIQNSLKDADPAGLVNPGVWEAAYYFVKGKTLSERPQIAQPRGGDPFSRDGRGPRGELVTPAPAYQQPQQPQFQQEQQFQQNQQPPAQQTPYFVEGPTAPSGNGAGGGFLDPNDELMARRFGVTVEEYRRWKGGQVPPQQQQQLQQAPVQQQYNNGGGNGWR